MLAGTTSLAGTETRGRVLAGTGAATTAGTTGLGFRTGHSHSLHCHRLRSCTQTWGWHRIRSLAGLGCVRVASGQLGSRKQVHCAGPQQSFLHLLALENILHHCIPISLLLEVLVNLRLLALIRLSIRRAGEDKYININNYMNYI